MPAKAKFKIEPPHYPIVYVRGYAMTPGAREETFNDAYYGFAATCVEARTAPKPAYFELDIFEGQLIRFLKQYRYADAFNRGLKDAPRNPSRSIWISRFYDRDHLQKELRTIENHAQDLRQLVCETIPESLEESGVDLGSAWKDYKVILIAHSMGGLVCRTLIQNLLPAKEEQPKQWIHRLVTIGSPHKGIELGAIPDFVEDLLTTKLNPFDANIFKEERMRGYLKLGEKKGKAWKHELHSLGPQEGPYSFPPARCFCLIGSDYHSYGATRHATGNFSDGLVKQDRAYIKDAYYANVHRAHSGYRGIVNCYESFENIHRFLFGNIKAGVSLDHIEIRTPQEPNCKYFYDFEFLASVRGTGVYLHRREQNPCENALRFDRDAVPQSLALHTGFMNSALKMNPDDPFTHFALTLRVIEHRLEKSWLWDHQYPGRQIYNETLEIRVGDADPKQPGDEVQFQWFSDVGGASKPWTGVAPAPDGSFRFPLRDAGAFAGTLTIQAGPWPDPALTED
ncbi:MAG: hypothetical protein HZA91_07660 [Verrucomicrobia bacterium]|nr:hypothetical protein [Verrucomicrobiota bacterium]